MLRKTIPMSPRVPQQPVKNRGMHIMCVADVENPAARVRKERHWGMIFRRCGVGERRPVVQVVHIGFLNVADVAQLAKRDMTSL